MRQMLCWSFLVFASTLFLGLAFLAWSTEGEDAESASQSLAGHGSVVGKERVSFPIEIPSSWQVNATGKEVGGWSRTGIAPGGLEDVVDEVGAIMSLHGFVEARRLAGDELGGDRKLIQYSAPAGIKVLWMLWDAGGGKTGFSWGRER